METALKRPWQLRWIQKGVVLRAGAPSKRQTRSLSWKHGKLRLALRHHVVETGNGHGSYAANRTRKRRARTQLIARRKRRFRNMRAAQINNNIDNKGIRDRMVKRREVVQVLQAQRAAGTKGRKSRQVRASDRWTAVERHREIPDQLVRSWKNKQAQIAHLEGRPGMETRIRV